MRQLRLLTGVLFFLLFLNNGLAQERQKPEWSYGLNPYYGGVFRYKPSMPILDLSHLYGIELYANKITNGIKPWQSLFNYPHVGFSAEYFNYGNPSELGEVYALGTYLDFTPNTKKKNQIRLNIGTGLVYSTQTFNAEVNPDNKAISSKISYILRGTVHYEIKLSEHYFFNINAAFRHYSNGKLNMPNNGMNFPIVGVGLRYVPNPQNIVYYKDSVYQYDNNIKFNAMVSTSWREVWQEDYKHKAYSASLYLSKQITKYNGLLLGVDGFLYDKESMRRAHSSWASTNPDIDENYVPNLDGRQLALTVGTELYMDRISVIVQGGFYIYKPQDIYDATWYQRYGLKYRAYKGVFTQFTLKAHSRTADMIEFGVGITL